MAIKQKLKKLTLINPLYHSFEITAGHDISILPINEKYIFEYENIPLVDKHRDPFDRLIIATTVFEKLDIITTDNQFDNYRGLVNIIW